MAGNLAPCTTWSESESSLPPDTNSTSRYLPPSSPPTEWESSGSESPETRIDDNLETIPDNVCTGQLIQWLAGSVWDTYAYQLHDDNVIGWMPIGYEDGNWIRLQSKFCSIFLQSPDELNCRSCSECFDLLNSKALLEFMDRAGKDTVAHMPWMYLNTKQLKNMLLASRKKLKLMQLKVCHSLT